jgi:uncharacterized protein YjbI with pentapeptide repeats
MSIQKKSLISALKTTKKANLASSTEGNKGENTTSMKGGAKLVGFKNAGLKNAGLKNAGLKNAGLKNAGLKNAGLKNAGLKSSGLKKSFEL